MRARREWSKRQTAYLRLAPAEIRGASGTPMPRNRGGGSRTGELGARSASTNTFPFHALTIRSPAVQLLHLLAHQNSPMLTGHCFFRSHAAHGQHRPQELSYLVDCRQGAQAFELLRLQRHPCLCTTAINLGCKFGGRTNRREQFCLGARIGTAAAARSDPARVAASCRWSC